MNENDKGKGVQEGDIWEIPGTGMSSDEWHRRKRAQQYAAEGLDPRRLGWKELHEQAERLRAQRRKELMAEKKKKTTTKKKGKKQ